MMLLAAAALWAGLASAATAPRRVVALMPSLAEAIVGLGQGKALVGAPEYTALPADLRPSVKALGPYPRISAEAVHALKPEIILGDVNGNDAQLIAALRRLGDRVELTDTRSLDGVVAGLRLVSRLMGQGESPPLLTELEAELRALARMKEARGSRPAPKVFLQLGFTPLVTVSDKTFIGEILQRGGVSNPFAKVTVAGYPKISAEAVVAADPDYIIVCPLTEDDGDVKRSMAFWKKFPKMKAVQGHHIMVLPKDALTKPGFGLARGIRALREALST